MVNKEDLAKAMGEENLRRPMALKLPAISLNGSKGTFVRRNPAEKKGDKWEKKEIGQTFNGVIVRVRLSLSEYNPNYRRETNEYDNIKEKAMLWETNAGVRSKIAEGTPEELRKAYPNLRARRILYLVVNDELVKLTVKGSGLGKLFKYFQEFGSNQHLFEFYTEFHPSKEENKAGMGYWALQPLRGAKLTDAELESIAGHITNVSENLKRFKEFYGDKPEAIEKELDLSVADEEAPSPVEEEELSEEDLPV